MICEYLTIKTAQKLADYEKLKRQIEIKDKYAQLIRDFLYDYDGYNDVDNLKRLIDEAREILGDLLDNNDKRVVYIGQDKKEYNILNEEIEKGSNNE